MKKIIVMRHADADADSNDFERELNDLGIEKASKAALFVKKLNINKVLCSSAKRTVQTLKLLDISNRVDCEFIEKLYTTDTKGIFQIIKIQSDQYNNILIIGHNPMLYEFVLKLTNKDVGNYKVSFLNKKMMPGNVVVINLASVFSWKDVENTENNCIEDIFLP